ncbi:thioesterase family [Trichoderma arundinaceum]|uniref:Thioesterase family n=1 Tax=Trichoderma arundinaceum TaxID=490622 RepID=A0A395NPG9_TRIAR|nr:thioesterase family [Trichoderma arundinaceum]
MSDNNNIPHEDTDVGKVEAWLNHFATRDGDDKSHTQGWMHNLIHSIKVISASSSLPHPSVTFSFVVENEHTNGFRNLHGGAAASLLDFCTSMVLVLIHKPGFWQTMGVSRTLNTTYMRPVPAGMEVLMECEILQVGKRLCALRGTMRRKSDGELLCVCEHNKANVDPDPKL